MNTLNAAAPARSLSICMTSDDFVPGATGVGTHVQIIAKHLVRLGHRITVITTRRAGEPEHETWHGVTVHRVPTVKLFGFYQAIPSRTQLRQIFESARPDVVHHHYLGLMAVRAMGECNTLGIKQVYTYHMTEDHLTQPLVLRPLRLVAARLIVKVCNKADLVISVSENLSQRLKKANRITPPIVTISNPVDLPQPAAITPAARDAAFQLLFAGRLNPEKNIPFLLRAFSRLIKKLPDSSLWIAGRGSDQTMLERQCRDLGIGSKVRFLGFLNHEDLSRHYAACDVFVLPSRVETQGLVAMEAMWFRKPIVVASSVVSATELVDEGINGYLVQPDNDSELAGRLEDLARTPALRSQLGDAGHRKATAFSPEIVIPQLVSTYRHL